MAIKIKIPRSSSSKSSPKTNKRRSSHFHLGDPLVKIAVAVFLVLSLAFFCVFAYYYVKYDRIITRKMKGQIFNNAAKIFARPETVRPGEKYTDDELIASLKKAGYTEVGHKPESKLGQYRVAKNAVEILPGPESFHSTDGAMIRFNCCLI